MDVDGGMGLVVLLHCSDDMLPLDCWSRSAPYFSTSSLEAATPVQQAKDSECKPWQPESHKVDALASHLQILHHPSTWVSLGFLLIDRSLRWPLSHTDCLLHLILVHAEYT